MTFEPKSGPGYKVVDRTPIAWRLGLDLGANSLGWIALRLDPAGQPCGILAAGARIFSDGRDPKSGASLAVDRRAARAMRRRRDRFKRRQAALLKYLIRDGLFPTDPVERERLADLDPFELRARSLDEALPLDQLGRALFHLNQRRGFQSNRKADRGADDDAGKIKIGVDRLRERIEAAKAEAGDEPGSWTFGKWLHEKRAAAANPNAIPSVRTRLRPETGEGAKGDGYDFYPSRDLLKHEFEAIWQAQAPYHPHVLTAEVHGRLHEIIFHQRSLRAVEVGRCTLLPHEPRLAKAHPLFQRRRLLEEVNALMIVRTGAMAERLTPEQRDTLLLRLRDSAKVKFESLRKLLKLDPADRFNKESENRPELKGDEVHAVMASKTRFGARWSHLSTNDQWEVIRRQQAVESEADDEAFRAWLTTTHDLSDNQAIAVSAARLPPGYGRFGETATTKLIDALREGRTPNGRTANAAATEPGRVIVYSEAVVHADLGHHSDHRTGEIHFDKHGNPALPYYGVALERHIMPGTADPDETDETARIGRLTNPTVHIGLNQLRRVVNALIRAYGPPTEIALELARELKLTDEEKKRRQRENNENRLAAEMRSGKLAEIGQHDRGANRALLKLWEELSPNVLDRRCVYSGTQISIEMLFSGAVEVDHILPFRATLDDSNANKILCLREANRDKGKRSPFEAWGHTDRWEEIAERAARLPRGKRWRFEPDAMEKFAGEEGFLARHLVDTQYLGRLARDYVAALYPDVGEGSGKVWVSPGRLTELVRRKLGLNDILGDDNIAGSTNSPKNRLDHRHHAIDAAVIAITDRSLLKRMATASGRDGRDGAERITVPEPWPGFRDELRDVLRSVTVAHRPDHGTVAKAGLKPGRDQTAARLHNDTAYGLTGETDGKGSPLVVHRIGLASLRKAADIEKVRDPVLRAALIDYTAGFDGKGFERRIADFPKLGPLPYRRIRHVRVIEPLAVIPVRDAEGRVYKGYKGDSNYRYDVWEMPDGKWVTQWRDRDDGTPRNSIVSMFDAHQSRTPPRPHPAARKVLSLQQDDLIAIEPDGDVRRLMRIVKFGQNGQITLAAPNEAGDLKRRDAAPNEQDQFKYSAPTAGGLKRLRARQVRVDELGRVLDPGFPARKAIRPTRHRLDASK